MLFYCLHQTSQLESFEHDYRCPLHIKRQSQSIILRHTHIEEAQGSVSKTYLADKLATEPSEPQDVEERHHEREHGVGREHAPQPLRLLEQVGHDVAVAEPHPLDEPRGPRAEADERQRRPRRLPGPQRRGLEVRGPARDDRLDGEDPRGAAGEEAAGEEGSSVVILSGGGGGGGWFFRVPDVHFGGCVEAWA